MLPTGWKSYGKEHTTTRGGKSHEADVKRGEGNSGMNVGADVKDAKHNPAPHKAAHAQHNKAVAGNADPTGMSPTVTKQATGHAPYHAADPGARKRAFDFNKRSEMGNADPSAAM